MNSKRFLFFLAFIFSSTFSNAQWDLIQTQSTNNLIEVEFINDSTGYLIDDVGILQKTNDKGTSWSKVYDFKSKLTSISVVSEDTIIVAGKSLYQSNNRGKNWTKTTPFNNVYYADTLISEIHFLSSKMGFAAVKKQEYCPSGCCGRYYDWYSLYKTKDGGTTWELVPNVNLDQKSRFVFLNSDYVIIWTNEFIKSRERCMSGDFGKVYTTTDGGNNWSSSYDFGPENNLPISMVLIDKKTRLSLTNHGYVSVSGAGVISRTQFNGIDFTMCSNKIDGFIITPSKIYKSKSNGINWTEDYTSDNTLTRIFNIKDKLLICLSQKGKIVRSFITPSEKADEVYKFQNFYGDVSFGATKVGKEKIVKTDIGNTGNTALELKIYAPESFQIGLTDSTFSDSLNFNMKSFTTLPFYIKFKPQEIKTYNELLVYVNENINGYAIKLAGEGTDYDGIEDLNKNSVVELFPNPASNFVTIELKNSALKNPLVKIYDNLGRLVLYETQLYFKSKIEVSHLPAGVYLMNFFDNEKEINISKLIKE